MDTNKPLYCFKFYCEGDIRIKRFVISDYTVDTHRYTKKRVYRFKKSLGTKIVDRHAVPESKIDKYLYDKVFTFNPDFEHAKSIIIRDLNSRINKAKEDMNKFSEIKKIAESVESLSV